MSEIHHDEHLLDRAAMLVMRTMLATQPTARFTPQSRQMFDELMEKTPRAEAVTFEEARVGGVPGWWCRPASAVEGRAVLYFHGGAYALGSALAYRNFASQIAVRAHAAVFIADYRLAPEHPYPAAVEDAWAAYGGLVEQGFDAIAIAGDSAGGGLALVLLERVTHARPRAARMPTAAAVMSPWTDLSLSGTSMETRGKHDPLLSRETLDEAAVNYAGSHDRRDPRISPLQGDLSRLPPVLLHVGEDEVLLDDSRRYQQRCEAAGGRASVHVWHGMTHVFPSSVSMLHAAREALDITGEFLDRALARRS
jgi:epsilon-lactone hydrolase